MGIGADCQGYRELADHRSVRRNPVIAAGMALLLDAENPVSGNVTEITGRSYPVTYNCPNSPDLVCVSEPLLPCLLSHFRGAEAIRLNGLDSLVHLSHNGKLGEEERSWCGTTEATTWPWLPET